MKGTLPWAWIDEEKALPWVEKRSDLRLADSRRAAIRLAPTAKAAVITGGPGVRKTTIWNPSRVQQTTLLRGGTSLAQGRA